jgi:Na+/proline symporter
MIDWAIVVAFVVYSVAAGFAARRDASKDLTEYFLAGRTLQGWRAGLSMAATQYAADTPLLVAGLVALGGVYSLWRLWSYGLSFLLMGFLLGRAWRRAGVLTDAELTEVRYSGAGVPWLRGLKGIYYGILINCIVMAFVLVAATRIFEIFLVWHEWLPQVVYGPIERLVAATGLDLWSGSPRLTATQATTNSVLSMVLLLGFVGLYSTTGGLRSVVATDVVQFALMMIGTALYAGLAVREAGGLDGLLRALHAHYGPERTERLLSFTPPAEEALFPFLTVLSLQWLFQMNSDGTGYLAQRTMACVSDGEARSASVVFTFAQVVLRSLLWLPIALALLVLYPFDPTQEITESAIAAREIAFAEGIEALLPAGARGLMLTGMLAALASTLDTHLNWGASYVSNDLYGALWLQRWRKRAPGRRELVIVARLSNLLILALALFIMAHLGSIQRAWQVSLLFGAGIGAVLVLRWLWERINLWCEVAAICASLVLAPVLLWTVTEDWVRLTAMAAGSTVVVLLTAWCTPATSEERLVEFFCRVQPPGWWRRTAVAAGVDPAVPTRALREGVRGIVGAAMSVYGFLLGGGLVLLQPARWPWALAAFGLALAGVPLWYRQTGASPD